MAVGFLWTQWRMARGRAQGAFRWAARLLPGVTAKAPATELFFDPERERRLVEQLDGLGEIPLAELGKTLGGSDEEATELVFTMIHEGRLDWVHDRTRRRVVARRLFVGAQAADGCAACGGVLGVRAGRAACLYCGVAPADERVG
jgi:hypothetical protein